MNRTPLALLAVATLSLAACSTPSASVEPSPASSEVTVAPTPAEKSVAATDNARVPSPAETPDKPKPAKEKAATKSAPSDPDDPIWMYLANIAANAAPSSDTGWLELINGAKDDGSALRIYTTVPADEWMNSETARTDYDVEGVCIGSMVYAGIMNDKGLAKFKEVWVMGSNLEPIEGCSWNDLTADMTGEYAEGDN